MCTYKMLKYHDTEQDFGNNKLRGNADEESLLRPQDFRSSSTADQWIKLDSELGQATAYYKELKSEVNGTE